MAFNPLKFLNIKKSGKPPIDAPKRGFAYNSGVPVYEDSAMQVSAFYRGVIYISSQIAKLPWNVKDAKNKIINDEISTMLDLSPNWEMNSFTFRLCMIQNAIIYGNAYAEIERDITGKPVALWPIHPNYMVVQRNLSSGNVIYKVSAPASNIPDVYLAGKDIFHLKNFHTKDGIMGQGIMAYAQEILGISLGADKMAGNVFSNGGMPSGVLEVAGTLSDEAYKRIKESWKENHGGKKSGGVAVLEEGIKFTPLSMSPTILQFLESRKFNVLEIARFLGIPPIKLFDMDGAKFANMENANLETATDCLDAWAKCIEMEADIKILNKRQNGRRTEMDLYEIFRGDMKTRAEYFSKMMQTAALTPNEIREKEGLSPYPDGDRYFVAINNYSPADRIDEIIDAQVNKNQAAPAPGSTASAGVNAASEELAKEALRFLQRK
jgi:HK97 family phage portal protein